MSDEQQNDLIAVWAPPDVARVFEAVLAERAEQDRHWGGAAHDDLHYPHDWLTYIVKQLGRVAELAEEFGRRESRRERYIKVMALCLAAMQSEARKSQVGINWPTLKP